MNQYQIQKKPTPAPTPSTPTVTTTSVTTTLKPTQSPFKRTRNCMNPNVYNLSAIQAIDNGLTVGFTILCKEKKIQLSIKSTQIKGWFGLTYGKDMINPGNASIYTSGKSGSNRNISLYTYWLEAHSLSDVIYLPQNDWNEILNERNGNEVSLIYETSLDNTPQWDINTVEIIFNYAYSADGSYVLNPHSSSTISSQTYYYNLATGETSSSKNSDTWKKIHGIGMIFTWTFLSSIGVLSSTFRWIYTSKLCNCKVKGVWFKMHRLIQGFVFLFTLIFFFIAVGFTNSSSDATNFSNTHEKLGLTLVILTFFQPINAYFRPHAPKKHEERTLTRFIWEIIHKTNGYTLWLGSQYIIYLGIGLLYTNDDYQNAFVYWLICLALIVFILFLSTFCPVMCCVKANDKQYLSNNKEGYKTLIDGGAHQSNSDMLSIGGDSAASPKYMDQTPQQNMSPDSEI